MYKAMAACKICEQELAVYNHGGVYCRNCQNRVSAGDGQGGIQEPGNTSYGRRKFGNILMKKSSGGLKSLSSLSIMPSLSSISSREELPSGKRALLCGVTYQKEKFKLRGTLAEEEPYRAPTRKNILEGFKWLMKNLRPGDSLVFYFSGHGLRQPEFDGDEIDGFDETICPLDFKSEGMILDNAINDIIVRPLRQGIKLHAIVDACHSGTILDLPRVYNRKEYI